MKIKLLQYLVCPSCGEGLAVKPFEEKDGELISGILRCGKCGNMYPVAEGIPRLFDGAFAEKPDFVRKFRERIGAAVPESSMSPDELKTRRTFEYEWLNYDVVIGNERDIFLEQTQLEPGELKGKLVIDIGCGMGRYTKVALDLGAEVLGFDIGRSVEKAGSDLKGYDNAHFVQGDIMALPIKEKSFDVLYSLGVLHHTRDAKKAFLNVARLVKPGGKATMWVYGRAGSFRSFSTNEFKKERRMFEILHNNKLLSVVYWLLIKAREFISNTSRLFTTRMPDGLLYGFCHVMAFFGKVPVLKYFTYSVLPDWKGRAMENFDWLSPRYQSHHTKEEIKEWFEESGYADMNVLPQGLVPIAGVKAVRK